jgi:hypothetical protein
MHVARRRRARLGADRRALTGDKQPAPLIGGRKSLRSGMNRQRPASGGGMKDGMVREWRIALDNGESRPATDDDLLAMQATLLLPMAEAKLRTFPPVKELHKQQKLLAELMQSLRASKRSTGRTRNSRSN